MTYTLEQQAANREKWLAALRSGEFLQAREALMNGSYNEGNYVGVGYCCLGVLCEVFKRETGLGGWLRDEDDESLETADTKFVVDEELDAAYGSDTNIQPPPAVAEWAGLVNASSVYGPKPTDFGTFSRPSLARANDAGEPFEEIAAIIESAPEGLFVS